MFAPRMQTAVSDSLNYCLKDSEDPREINQCYKIYNDLKREDGCYFELIDVLRWFDSVMHFNTFLKFMTEIARRLESVSSSEINAYKGWHCG